MKKIVAISTLIIYLALSAVQVISLHFCQGRLQSVLLSGPADSCCSGMHGVQPSCCEDIVIEVDFDTDHIYSEELRLQDNCSDVFLVDPFRPIADITENHQDVSYILQPEISPFHTKLYRLHSSFLFYG